MERSVFQAFSHPQHFKSPPMGLFKSWFLIYNRRMKVLSKLPMLLTAVLAMGLAGCGKPATQTPGTPPEKSTAQTAIDGFTGKTAVDAGLRAKEQIKKASEAQMKDREEILQ